jgi:hypothetical protein
LENHTTETAPNCNYDSDDDDIEEDDKENCSVNETAPEKYMIELETPKDSCCDRKVLGEINHKLCVQTCCNKRKQTELEDACESILPKRCKFDTETETPAEDEHEHSINVEQTQISSLVSRFNSGLSSLADSNDSLSSKNENSSNRNRLGSSSCMTHKNSTQNSTTTSNHLQYKLPSNHSTGVLDNWARPIEAF